MTKKEIERDVFLTNVFVAGAFLLAIICGAGLAFLEIAANT